VETFLIDEWLEDGDGLPILDEASVASAREMVRAMATSQGMSQRHGERLALIASELGYNQLFHARKGRVDARAISRAGVAGVEIVAADEGKGIADPTSALAGAPRSTGSLGVGVATARAQSDEIDFDVRIDEGTCVRARVFASDVPRRRQIGIYGRAYPGELRSGDHARFFRVGEALVVAVCDGLGHGPPARTAAGAAIQTAAAHAAESPLAIVEACHRGVSSTRGAVMAVVRIDETSPAVDKPMSLASVGNITVEAVRPRSARRFAASSFVVGAAQKGWRAHVEESALERDEALVAFTDGIPSRVSVADELELLREHPIVIAHQMVARFARDSDDVLVLVAR